ncbi:cobalt ECF transporter T component CbiQ [Ethanoligenens sp.]|uniref:cobalt ECF transporter T component CbiQ n=1 Tax=Ethanoligenens sp. TaxID=2099655 RepID=UPI0039E9A818
MELGFFKSLDSRDTPLNRLDGRLKTVFFLLLTIIAAIVRHWYLALGLWLAALAAYSTLKLSWHPLVHRLLMPFSIAWLVFLSVMFTNGNHPLWTILEYPFSLVVYREGLALGFLMMLRIMAAVTMASLLSFSTPMAEILETLRSIKIPDIMVDIAELMARYVFVLEETAHNMSRAQVSRTTCQISWMDRIRNTGAVAGYVMVKAFDRSIKIYNAMLARGYSEENPPTPYFNSSISSADIRKGAVMMTVPVAVLLVNYLV